MPTDVLLALPSYALENAFCAQEQPQLVGMDLVKHPSGIRVDGSVSRALAEKAWGPALCLQAPT